MIATMPKRKHDTTPRQGVAKKKRAISDADAHSNFRDGLFDQTVLDGYTQYYAKSQPYVLHFFTHSTLVPELNLDLICLDTSTP